MTWFTYLTRRAEVQILAGSSLLYSLTLWLIPKLALAVAVLAFLAVLALVAARIVCAARFAPQPLPTDDGNDGFVSIHIATYSEPPDVVCRTLDSLARLDYSDYEVIVLDNNTPDPALYEPVREHCRKLGERFRFYHYDNVKGAKAGALNISLDLCRPGTDVILVLDADYQAEPDCLRTGMSHFVDSEIALVQFPQAYRNSADGCGLTWEYKLFFDVYMNLANRWNTVLSTGTAAFVNKRALEKSGGWSGDTLTEDAELGLRLHRRGYRAVYVPEVKAAGLMPTDLDSLRAQRRRWVLGNAQSLGALLRERAISLPRKLLMTLQLTAWASPLLLPLVTLLVGVVAHLGGMGETATAIAAVSILSIFAYLAGMLVFFVLALARQGASPWAGAKAYLIHLGLLWEASVCPCELFVQSDKSFVRTDKFLRAPKGFALLATALAALLSGMAGVSVVWSGGAPMIGVLLTLLALLVTGRAFLRWSLHVIRQRTAGQE